MTGNELGNELGMRWEQFEWVGIILGKISGAKRKVNEILNYRCSYYVAKMFPIRASFSYISS